MSTLIDKYKHLLCICLNIQFILIYIYNLDFFVFILVEMDPKTWNIDVIITLYSGR